jgi:hypothetical protein
MGCVRPVQAGDALRVRYGSRSMRCGRRNAGGAVSDGGWLLFRECPRNPHDSPQVCLAECDGDSGFAERGGQAVEDLREDPR